MSAYYDSNAPWFAKGRVKFADGRLVDVSEVRAGDAVATSTGLCAIKTLCRAGIQPLVMLHDSVLVTCWHPVRSIGSRTWSLPADLNPPEVRH
jgi:hypothetical protein